MGIKRGSWKVENFNKSSTIHNTRHGPKSAIIPANGQSRSESHMESRSSSTGTSASQGISEVRQEQLIRGTAPSIGLSKTASPLLVNSPSFKHNQQMKDAFIKNASTSTATFGGTSGGGGNTVRVGPEVYSPLFQIANLQLPRDRITMNAWNRNFYDTHPLVHNCINLHATYPIGKINIKCKDRKVQQFFEDQCEKLDIINVLQAVALEFFKLGEVFPYAELDEANGMWKNILIQNPDYMHIKTSVLGGDPVISMRPDAALQRLVHSNAPADMQLRGAIDPEILYHVKKGNNIPLDNFHISHLKMLSSPYDIHGTSVIVSIYKDLMLYDKLRESKFAQADSLVNPITLIKVGGSAEGEYHPTPEALEEYRQIFEQSAYDKDFKIITHAGVAVERVGASGAIIDISGDMAFIMDNIMNGLMVPKTVITQEGSSFSSASVGLEVLKQRYESFRNMIAQWLTKKIFAPISEIQEFYEYKDGEKKLIVPEIEWNTMILYDMDNYINIINGLVQSQAVSRDTLFKSLGLNVDEERRKIRDQTVQDIIAQKELQQLQGMTLGALRSLGPDDEVIEQTEAPLPGVPGSEEAGIPGASPGGMPGGGMGGPPLGSGGLGGGGAPPLGGGGLGGPPSPGGGLGPPGAGGLDSPLPGAPPEGTPPI